MFPTFLGRVSVVDVTTTYSDSSSHNVYYVILDVYPVGRHLPTWVHLCDFFCAICQSLIYLYESIFYRFNNDSNGCMAGPAIHL